jgi:hypothetical protein
MFGSGHGTMRLPQSLVGPYLRRRYRAPLSMSGECSTTAIFIEHTPRRPCSWYVIQLDDRIIRVLEEEIMLEAGATKGRDLPLEVRRIRP